MGHKLRLTPQERKRLMANAFMIRSMGIRTLSVASLMPPGVRARDRRTILIRRELRRVLAMIERVLGLTDRTTSCWLYQGKMRGQSPVCYDGHNLRSCRRLLVLYSGVEIPPGRLKTTCGNARCIFPKHVRQYLEATGERKSK